VRKLTSIISIILAATIITSCGACVAENYEPYESVDSYESDEPYNSYEPYEADDLETAEAPTTVEVSLSRAEQIVAEFLGDWLSLFSLGRRTNLWDNDSDLANWRDWSVADSPPLVYGGLDEENMSQFFDQHGNIIPATATFIYNNWGNNWVAHSFSLYDFGDGGIPVILIRYANFEWGFTALYRFVDGQYRRTEVLAIGTAFYTDSNGELVVVEFDHGEIRVSYLTLTADRIQKNVAVDWTWFEEFEWIDYAYAPNIMEIGSLTPIEPLTEMEERVTSVITRRLGL